MKLSKENFKAEQLTKSGSRWGVWFFLDDRGVSDVSVYFNDIKAPSKEKAIERVIIALKRLEIVP